MILLKDNKYNIFSQKFQEPLKTSSGVIIILEGHCQTLKVGMPLYYLRAESTFLNPYQF